MRWEYLVIEYYDSRPAQVEQRLTKLGSQGWELVTVTMSTHTSGMLYLKRVAQSKGEEPR